MQIRWTSRAGSGGPSNCLPLHGHSAAAVGCATDACRKDLLFETGPGWSTKAVARARLVTAKAPGDWVAWSAVSFTMCPVAL